MSAGVGDPQAAMAWAEKSRDRVVAYVQSLSTGVVGEYRPCNEGLTAWGQRVHLGYSCYALKIQRLCCNWEKLSETTRMNWAQYIQAFQSEPQGLFIDGAVKAWYASRHKGVRGLARRVLRRSAPDEAAVLLAETKQAIATLADVGAKACEPCRAIPESTTTLRTLLEGYDWDVPWGAGAHTANHAVLLQTQGRRWMDDSEVRRHHDVFRQVLDSVADAKTGGYFRRRPAPQQLVNGAMKVLNALEWLEIPIHYPEKLIDFCLANRPGWEGCHVVDWVYALYRCLGETEYRVEEIHHEFLQILGSLQIQQNADGGFSYWRRRSQVTYYGVPIAEGAPVSDLHGSVLFTWALAMICSSLGATDRWQVIRV